MENYTETSGGHYLSVSEDCLRAWRSARKGPAWPKQGQIVRYDVNDLDAFLAGTAQGRRASVSDREASPAYLR